MQCELLRKIGVDWSRPNLGKAEKLRIESTLTALKVKLSAEKQKINRDIDMIRQEGYTISDENVIGIIEDLLDSISVSLTLKGKRKKMIETLLDALGKLLDAFSAHHSSFVKILVDLIDSLPSQQEQIFDADEVSV
jgi:acetolactate synthase regulatory subunit